MTVNTDVGGLHQSPALLTSASSVDAAMGEGAANYYIRMTYSRCMRLPRSVRRILPNFSVKSELLTEWKVYFQVGKSLHDSLATKGVET